MKKESANGSQSPLLYRLGILFCLYFSQGVPFGFFSHALPPLLRSYGVNLEVIGIVSALAAPWALKFMWAPVLDRFGSIRYGFRKSWIIPLQGCFVGVLVLISMVDPEGFRGGAYNMLFFLLFLSNLVAATQDIATDGMAVEILSPAERGPGNGVQVAGYRVGMMLGGGVVLILLDYLGWAMAFYCLAVLIILATVPVLVYREPPLPRARPHTEPRHLFYTFLDFIRQPRIWPWILVVALYKAGDAFGSGMTKPMLIDSGLSVVTVGWLSGVVGMVAGIAGALTGGFIILRLGRVRALLWFGLFQALSILGYYLIARGETGLPFICVVSVFEHFIGGMATAALFTLMMDACRVGYAGTDYTVQASIQVIVAGGLHMLSGFSAGYLGYEVHFMLSFAISLIILGFVLFWAKYIPVSQQNNWKNG